MKNLLTIFCILLSSGLFGQIINFPDPKFQNALVNTNCVDTDGDNVGDADADLNNDGEIDVSESRQIIGLIVPSDSLNDLTGINEFLNLEKLRCNNNFIENMDLSKNVKLTSLICYQNNLMSLNIDKLPNLEILSCQFNKIGSLNLNNFIKLKFLHCNHNQLTNLQLVGAISLQSIFCQNNLLTSLNVENCLNLFQLNCSENQLIYVNLKNGHFIQIFKIGINQNLRYICCDDEYNHLIAQEAFSAHSSGFIINSYCSFTPGGKFYSIIGVNRFDANNNGCEETDKYLKNVKYKFTDGVKLGYIIPNSTGNYVIPIQVGTHTITPILENPSYFNITPTSFTVTFPSTSDTITQDFCITPIGIFRQTNITVIPLSPPARPGFDAKYKIVWENVGNQIESGTINFTFDETRLDYISATSVADIVADGIIKWNFSDLRPFEKREIIVTLKINRPTDTPAVNAGDKLYLTASILDNIFTLENTVVGSYDPNDKTCLQGERIHPDQIGKYVDFLIRFENTGNYAAKNVVVKDIIDTKTFDVSSLQITDASHEVYARIEGNKVEFIFEKIQLPFDDANNDGYIAFKIKTLPTLMVGDSLKNLADIYFDYNFPIRTNETKSKLAFPVSTNDLATEVNVYPNPVTDILYLSTDEAWTKAEIFDVSGRIIRSFSLDRFTVDVSGMESGTYFIRLKHGDKVGLVKFLKM